MGLEIAQKKKSGKDASSMLAEMKDASMQLAEFESAHEDVKKRYSKLALTVPNLIDRTVPIGADESANKEIKKWGSIPNFDFEVKDHIDISENFRSCGLAASSKGCRSQILLSEK